MQRIFSVSASALRVFESSARSATLSAFFFSGRLSVNHATPVFSSILALINLVSAMKIAQRVQAVQIVVPLTSVDGTREKFFQKVSHVVYPERSRRVRDDKKTRNVVIAT